MHLPRHPAGLAGPNGSLDRLDGPDVHDRLMAVST
jgi:hypothetical protein